MNSVLDMVMKPRSEEERARELNDRSTFLQEVRVKWSEVRELGEHPGWKTLEEEIASTIDGLRSRLETTTDTIQMARLQGQMEAYKWFARVPSLADIRLAAVDHEEGSLNAEKEQFVQTGA